jgi:hypothetical protein
VDLAGNFALEMGSQVAACERSVDH